MSAGHKAGPFLEEPILNTRSATITGSHTPTGVGRRPVGSFSGYALEASHRG